MDDVGSLADDAISLVERWLARAETAETRADRLDTDRLGDLVTDPAGVAFAMRFVDRVIRPEDHRVAAHQLAMLVAHHPLPGFLSPIDRLLLRAGARLAPILPRIVMPLAIRRLRGIVGHLVVDADPAALERHLAARRSEGFRLNVNLLGEAVLGDAEASRRHAATLDLLEQPDVDYVSVKTSAIVAQLDPWDLEGSVDRVVERLRPLYERAGQTDPPTFVNLDMEEYHDLELTMTAFMRLLDEPELRAVEAGIVLQAYLPDSFSALHTIVEWANRRAGGSIKIRLVKGANLAMERVDAAIHGWEQAPYGSKAETDANYKRCLDWVLTPDRTRHVRIGVASHNLFDVAWAHLVGQQRGVADRVEFEMLQGMAPAQARVVRDESGGLLLYTPVVAPTEFDVAISYLFRRLEENADPDNFMRHLFELRPGSDSFATEAARFVAAVEQRWSVGDRPRRESDRSPVTHETGEFRNEPDTDPALSSSRDWALAAVRRGATEPATAITDDVADIDHVMARAASAQPDWARRPPADRRAVLHAVANELSRRRGDVLAAMVHEGRKTIAQADPEISEAIDFARWYGDRALDLDRSPVARFDPLGVLAVVPPWNFPVAIPAGGVLAALAAGNAVVFKPAPETPRCAEIVAECCWSAGVPADVLHFVRTRDDDVGRHLITHPSIAGIILTGAYETAQLFRSWRPDLRIWAETSGKNSLVITPNADIDLAVDDLVTSAFGHSGQKCSAASLAVCVGDVVRSPRFRRQLIDAVESMVVGQPDRPGTTVGPTIHEPEGKLLRALTTLEPGEEWLVEPRRLGEALWSPGVRLGVEPGSWFHRTECFGPVLGVVETADLDDAIAIQNGTDFGLTGGIHSLDPGEIDHWLDHVEIGNAYVNRQITGAIVQRQPFGGWKRSSIGPAAKAGGPNYVAQLGTWDPTDDLDADGWLAAAESSDEAAWSSEFAVEHDPTGLFCEANVFRYRPFRRVAVRVEGEPSPRLDRLVERVLAAARRCGVEPIVSRSCDEAPDAFAGRLAGLAVERVRVVSTAEQRDRASAAVTVIRDAADAVDLHVVDEPVTGDGRIELLHYLREQSISRTLHRHGNLL